MEEKNSNINYKTVKQVIVIVDMQNDFIDGALGSEEAKKVVPKIKEKLLNIENNPFIILTKDTHSTNYLNTQEGKNLPVPHCIKKSEGWRINPEIKKTIKYLYEKNKTSGVNTIEKYSFGSTYLPTFLKGFRDLQEIVLIGVCTDICVVSNALILKANFPEIKVTVDAACCAGVTPEKHKNALETMKSCQINVINEKEQK